MSGSCREFPSRQCSFVRAVGIPPTRATRMIYPIWALFQFKFLSDFKHHQFLVFVNGSKGDEARFLTFVGNDIVDRYFRPF